MQKGSKRWLAFLLAIVTVVSYAISGCGFSASAEAAIAAETEYAPRKDIETILVMGTDKFERPDDNRAYVNNMQCDFLLLLVVDKTNEKIIPIHLNRDTMTKINRLGVFGGAVGSYEGQLALAHAYGSGGSDSDLNAVRAVSNFLEGVQIDHYMCFTMDSVAVVNDAVGGVTVTIEDDFSDVDPTLIQGETMTLMGDQALHFVRYRHYVGDMTNLSRMVRQRQYMSNLYEKVIEAAKADDSFVQRIVFKLGDGFQTNCTVTQMENLFELAKSYSFEPFVTIEGEAIKGEVFMEFYADPDSVHEVVQTYFYEPVSNG